MAAGEMQEKKRDDSYALDLSMAVDDVTRRRQNMSS